MNSGELFDYITENGRLEEGEARHLFQQVSMLMFLAQNHPHHAQVVKFIYSIHNTS